MIIWHYRWEIIYNLLLKINIIQFYDSIIKVSYFVHMHAKLNFVLDHDHQSPAFKLFAIILPSRSIFILKYLIYVGL